MERLDEQAIKDLPIYRNSVLYALACNELDLFFDSDAANKICASAIDAAIKQYENMITPSIDGDAPEYAGAVSPLTETAKNLLQRFGPERIAYVLASTIRHYELEGRFTQENRDWALSVPMYIPDRQRLDYNLHADRTVLNAFANTVREELAHIPSYVPLIWDFKEIPLYRHSLEYAKKHGQRAEYYESHDANTSCRDAIVSEIMRNIWLVGEAKITQTPEQFGDERTMYIISQSIREYAHLPEISGDDKAWAETAPDYESPDISGKKLRKEYLIDRDKMFQLTPLIKQLREDAERTRTGVKGQEYQQEISTERDVEKMEHDMRSIPVYPYSAAYASFAGELDQFRESKKANQECGKAIDAVFDAWNGVSLPPEAGKALMERFGPERLGYVLADTVQQRSGDGRFSPKNREWARNCPMLVSQETRWEIGPKSHSAKLDGLITQLRPELEQSPELAARAEVLKNIPLYQNSMQFAQNHGEGMQYAASHEANILCKEAVEASISSNHDGYVLKNDGAINVAKRFGFDRTFFVLAATVREKSWDQRFSRDNINWAETQPSYEDKNASGQDMTRNYMVQSQPGLTDLFLNQVREQYALEQERTAAQREAENPLKNAELLIEDDTSMIDGIINNGAKDAGRPKVEQQDQPKTGREERNPQRKPSIRERLTEKPPEQEKPAAPPRKWEVSL